MNWVWNHSTLSQQQWTSVCKREGLGFGGRRAQRSSYELLSQFTEARPWKGSWWFLPGSGYRLLHKKHQFRQTGARQKSELIYGMGWVKAPLQKAHEEKKERAWSGRWTERAGTAEVGSRFDLVRTEMPNQKWCTKGCWSTSSLQSTSGAWEQGVACSTGEFSSPSSNFLLLWKKLCIPRNIHPFWKRMLLLNSHREEEEMQYAERL